MAMARRQTKRSKTFLAVQFHTSLLGVWHLVLLRIDLNHRLSHGVDAAAGGRYRRRRTIYATSSTATGRTMSTAALAFFARSF
jgi:hypothetical protein